MMEYKSDLILPVDNDKTTGEYDLDISVVKHVYQDDVSIYKKESTLHVLPKLFDATTDNSQYWNVPGPVAFSMADGIVTLRSQFVQGMYVNHVQDLSDYLDNEVVVLKFLVRSLGINRFYMSLGDGRVSSFSATEEMIDNQLWVWLEYHFDDNCWYLNGQKQTQTISTLASTEGNVGLYIMVGGRMTVQISNMCLSAFRVVDGTSLDLLDLEGTFKVSTAVSTTGQGLSVEGTSDLDATASLTVGVSVNYGTATLTDYEVTNYLSGLVLADDNLYYRIASSSTEETWKRVDLSQYTSAVVTINSNDTRQPVISYSPYVYQLPQAVIEGGSIDREIITLDTTIIPVTLTAEQVGTAYGLTSLSVSLTDYFGDAVTSGTLTATIDGTTTTYTITDGTATVPITASYGSYDVVLSYTGTDEDDYDDATLTTSITVTKQTPTLTAVATPTELYMNDTVTITGYLLDENGDGISGATINIPDGTVTTESDGSYIGTYSPLEVGTYRYRVRNTSDSMYNQVMAEISMTTRRRPTTLTLDAISDVRYGDPVNVTGTLVDHESLPITNATVRFYLQGVSGSYTATTDSSGDFSVELSELGHGSYTLRAYYGSDNTYASSNATGTFTVNLIVTTLSLDAISDCIGGDTVTLTGTLIDEDDNALSGQTITLYDGNNYYDSVSTGSDGSFTSSYIPDSSGTFEILARFTSHDEYSGSRDTKSFTVTPQQTSISLDSIEDVIIGNAATIKGYVLDADGDTISGDVTVSILSSTSTVRITGFGYFTTSYTPQTNGEIEVTVSYEGEGYYAPSSATASFTSMDLIETSIIASTRTNNNGVYLVGQLIETVSGEAIQGATLIFEGVNNGADVTRNTGYNGQAVANCTSSSASVITTNIRYEGSEIYAASETGEMEVVIEYSSAVIRVDSISDCSVGDTVTVSGMLCDEDSGVGLADTTLSILYYGLNYRGRNYKVDSFTVTTSSDGSFSLDVTTRYKLNATGAISMGDVQWFTVAFDGNDAYPNSVSVSSNTFNVNTTTQLSVDTITRKAKGASITASGYLLDADSNPISDATIKVVYLTASDTYVWSPRKSVTGVTLADGSYSISGITAGYVEYNPQILSVAFGGDDNNLPAYNYSNEFNTESGRKGTVLTLDSIGDCSVGDSVTVSGSLVDSDGVALSGVTVIITDPVGDTVDVSTGSDGSFSTTYSATVVGSNTITAAYPGDDSYAASDDSVTFTVSKKGTVLTLDSISDCSVGDSVTVSGILTDSDSNVLSGKDVVISGLSDESVTVSTGSDGTFSSDFTMTTTGSKTVSVTFSGDDSYAASDDSVTFTVSKRGTVLTLDSISDCSVGDTITISGTLVDANNNPLSDMELVLDVGEDAFYPVTLSDGTFNESYTPTTVGEYEVYVYYGGDSTHESSNDSSTFTVTQATTFETHFATQSLWTNYANMDTYTSGGFTYWVSASSSSTKHYYTEYNMQEILSHGDISLLHYTHRGDGRSNLGFYDPTNDQWLGYTSSLNSGTIVMKNTKDGITSSLGDAGQFKYGISNRVTISLSGTTLSYTYTKTDGSQVTNTIDIGTCDLSNYYLCFYTYSKSMDVLFDTEITD